MKYLLLVLLFGCGHQAVQIGETNFYRLDTDYGMRCNLVFNGNYGQYKMLRCTNEEVWCYSNVGRHSGGLECFEIKD